MSSEVRIYFECLEQAEHFIYPIVHKAIKSLGVPAKVKLVRMKKSNRAYSRNIAPILFWKVPDILLTIIQEGVEYPLLLVEFSNAVFTEDHELQRFDGLVAAANNQCLYAKISPSSKESISNHGGNIDFDYAGPFSLIKTKYNRVFFHFDWPCDSSGFVEVEADYLSCPKVIPEFEFLIQQLLAIVVPTGISSEWTDKLTKKLCSTKFFSDWMNRLDNFQQPNVTTLDTSRTTWIRKDVTLNREVLELKLNRFGHAMDPERGMLAYYGTMGIPIVSKMMFSLHNDAWFKGISKESELRNHVKKSRLKSAFDYLYGFALGSALCTNDQFMKIVESFKTMNREQIVADISPFVQKNYLNMSKPIRTILKYSELFVIEDSQGFRRVILKWKSIDETGLFSLYPTATKIAVRTSLGEDDVTHITIHNVMRTSGYKILAASYPGAQADRVILVAPGTGRKQTRKYVDVIAYLPPRITTIQENKGQFSLSGVQSDIEQVCKFKNDKKYKEALKEFQLRMLGPNLQPETITGVGFWASKSFNISKIKELKIELIDYFLYISKDMKTWQIWTSCSAELFHKKKGYVTLPAYFEISA